MFVSSDKGTSHLRSEPCNIDFSHEVLGLALVLVLDVSSVVVASWPSVIFGSGQSDASD